MKNKALRAFVLPLLLFFTLSTVTAPARAVLPVIAAGVSLVTEGGLVANGLTALTVGTVAGMIYLAQNGTGSGSTSGSIMEIPLGVGRDRPLDTPSGYTPPINNNAQPTPPGTSAPIKLGYKVNGADPVNASAAGACLYATTYYDGARQYTTMVGGYYNWMCTHAGVDQNVIAGVQLGCSAGYTLSGNSCVLSNAALVQKPADGRCQILASVSGFSVDPQDPECGELASKGINVAPGEITFGKPGELTNGKVTRNGDGSRTATYSKVNSDNKTTTITTYNFLPADPVAGTNAVVTGSTTVVVNGTGTAAAPASAAPAAPAIDFPDDYNREATQGQIKTNTDSIKTDMESVKGDLDGAAYAMPAAAPSTPAEMIAAENKKITDELGLIGQTYDNFKLLDWSTWVPTLPAAGCSPITKTVMGKNFTWDLCPKIALLNELIGWLLAVFAGWSVVSLMFRSRAN